MKLRRKLLAAGFAFGATALTLTTSTFAWYTANNEVTVDSINGSTSASADSSSIYIAAAKTYASVSAEITASAPGAKVASITSYGREASPVFVNSGATRVLTPVYYAGENDYKTLTGVATDGTTVNYAKDSTASAVYEFVLRFQKPNATASTPVYVSKFDVTNTAAASDSQQQALAYETDTAGVGVKEEGVYNVDMLHALKMTVATTPLTDEGKYDSSASTTTKIYDLDGYAQTSKDVNMASAPNAIAYYNAVLSTSISAPTNYLSGATCIASTTAGAANSTTSNLFTIPSTGYVEVRFTFWLDGWDTYCYDVCRLQNFKVDMSFTTAEDKSVLTTATAA